MSILINEIKKVFNLKFIILLLLISGVMYKLYITPQESMVSGGEFINNIHVQLVKDYGNTMDENEYKDFKNKYNEKVKIADSYIKNDKECYNLGIYNYEEFYKISRNNGEEKYENPKLHELQYKYMYESDQTLFRELQEFENIIICYEGNTIDNEEVFFLADGKTNFINREKEIINSKAIQSLLPYIIFESYDNQFKWLTNLVLISIVFLLSPIYLDDKKNKVNYLQYSSKHGRKIFKSKIGAGLICSLIITSIQLLVFFSRYFNETNKVFLNCDISGYYNSPITSWYSLNFGQYMIITSLLLYLLSIVITLVCMYVSSKANSYTSLIGIQILILFIINKFLLKYLINNATSMYIQIFGLNYAKMPKYFLQISYITLITIAFIFIINAYKKETKISLN